MTDRRKRKRRMVPATYVPSINIMSKEGTPPHLPFSSGKKWTRRLRQIAAKKRRHTKWTGKYSLRLEFSTTSFTYFPLFRIFFLSRERRYFLPLLFSRAGVELGCKKVALVLTPPPGCTRKQEKGRGFSAEILWLNIRRIRGQFSLDCLEKEVLKAFEKDNRLAISS